MEREPVILEVGISDMKISSSPDIIVTRGLGSCVGIVIYDTQKKIGGLAHAMMPSIEIARNKEKQTKFVDSVINLMLEQLKKQGCSNAAMIAKLCGGAHMFAFIPMDGQFAIGARNIQAVKESLRLHNIRLVAEDTGGNHGRTMFLDLAAGQVRIKTVFHGEIVL